ncbi:MAG: hypothetical protein HY873_04670 [Chloroflexi bacterium]|nr:hypothetical protein [Chloroflexota bacterium]
MGVDFGIDLDEVRRVIDGAEVLVIRFSVTDRRLLIDTRSNEHAGPMIKVVPPAKSAEERFRAIKVLRPRFRVPERVVTFHWPRHARALGESGVWDHVCRRLEDCRQDKSRTDFVGRSDATRQCDEAYTQLLDEERKVELGAIRGAEGFQTVWPVGTVADE